MTPRPARARLVVRRIMPVKPPPPDDDSLNMRPCALIALDETRCRWPLDLGKPGRRDVLRRRRRTWPALLPAPWAAGILVAMPLTSHRRRDLLRIEQSRDADAIAEAP